MRLTIPPSSALPCRADPLVVAPGTRTTGSRDDFTLEPMFPLGKEGAGASSSASIVSERKGDDEVMSEAWTDEDNKGLPEVKEQSQRRRVEVTCIDSGINVGVSRRKATGRRQHSL